MGTENDEQEIIRTVACILYAVGTELERDGEDAAQAIIERIFQPLHEGLKDSDETVRHWSERTLEMIHAAAFLLVEKAEQKMRIESRLTKIEEAQAARIDAESRMLLKGLTDEELDAIISDKIGQPVDSSKLTDEDIEMIRNAPMPEETLADKVEFLAYLRQWIATQREAGAAQIEAKTRQMLESLTAEELNAFTLDRNSHSFEIDLTDEQIEMLGDPTPEQLLNDKAHFLAYLCEWIADHRGVREQ